ncbi:uncharacterized protein LOC110951007 isoform X2 [Acanthochromis polyacanthus]|uniref:uncharacterized protein LOC110951007 isoform X2 n=1 Tax=Acanthochromis polyacanthus TaxID=80966 RepID=UPI0022340468|nr:uncharacterized protein LOC110951007 isoform X2 [Acanthochromis polyacanthus]
MPTDRMDWDENSSHSSQCPATSARVKLEEPSSEKVELMLGLKTSRPKMPIELCSSVCSDDAVMAHHHSDDERDEDGGNRSPGSVCAHVGASQKDVRCGEDEGSAAAHTQMPNTKPKAGALVACRQLIDGSEAASLESQSQD